MGSIRPPGPLRIAFVGNLIPRKGLHVLLDALALAAIDVPAQETQAYYQAHASTYHRGEMVRARMILCSSRENAEALKFSLTEDEVDTLAQATLAWRA